MQRIELAMSELKEDGINVIPPYLATFINNSEEYFKQEIQKYDDSALGKFYDDLFNVIHDVIMLKDIEYLKNLSILVNYISKLEEKSLASLATSKFHEKNIFILACKRSKSEMFEYIFSQECTILEDLSKAIKKSVVSLLRQEDYECHNVFYYAIRTNNFKSIDNLVTKWRSIYKGDRQEDLNKLLSQAYHELKWKNFPISSSMETMVENAILNLRFVPETSNNAQEDLKSIKERITLVIGTIDDIVTNYDTKKADDKFVFTALFIAKNIFILKSHLKSTYDQIPWEEMEFCLSTYVHSLTRSTDFVNLIYKFSLPKESLLKYLKQFALRLKKLQNQLRKDDIGKKIVKAKREEVITNIIANCPEFIGLYQDFQIVRDAYSLKVIRHYLQVAMQANPNFKEGRLVILRTLHMLGECLRNTLDAPNMSPIRAELLLLVTSRHVRYVIMDIRNSLSPAYTVNMRLMLECNAETTFYNSIKQNMESILNIVNDIFFDINVKIITDLLDKINKCNNIEEFRTVIDVVYEVNFHDLYSMAINELKVKEHREFEEIFLDLMQKINNITPYEHALFTSMKELVQMEYDSEVSNYISGFKSLESLFAHFQNVQAIEGNVMKVIKFIACSTRAKISSRLDQIKLNKIAEMSLSLFESVSARINFEDFEEIQGLFVRLSYIGDFQINNLRWIEDLRERLHPTYSDLLATQSEFLSTIPNDFIESQLNTKITFLHDMFNNMCYPNNKFNVQLSFYKTNIPLLINMESLVLDILSILHVPESNYFMSNVNFLDVEAPLLVGHSLWYYLMHKHIIFDTLSFDTTNAVILNALNILETENIKPQKIGKTYRTDVNKVKSLYERDIFRIELQKKMYDCLESGGAECFLTFTEKGADIYARTIRCWTALHFAAKGPNLETVRELIDLQVDMRAKNIEGKNALHIAAACGRTEIVKYLLECGFEINTNDFFGFTPLHLAARNKHGEMLITLLKKGANAEVPDCGGSTPLHQAVWSKSLETVKILLDKLKEGPVPESKNHYSCFHLAVEIGHIDIVNYLLPLKLNLNLKNDKDILPLHAAILNGHVDVARALIENKCNVNQKTNEGFTALLYATELCCEEIVHLLLENGAHVNVCDKFLNFYPIHYCAKNGILKAVQTLIDLKTDVNIKNSCGKTPLHLATNSGHFDIIKLLMANKAQINAKDNNGHTALHVAAGIGSVDITKFLINHGAKVNIRTRKGQTALHMAAGRGMQEVVELLLKEGVEVNAADENGFIPLHLSAQAGFPDGVEILLQNGAKINEAGGNCRWTALHLAAGWECLEELNKRGDVIASMKIKMRQRERHVLYQKIVKSLISFGAAINVKDRDKFCPLHLAAITGNPLVVEVLIASGARVDCKDAKGISPLSYAVQCGYEDVAKLLVQKGAAIDVKIGENSTLLCSAVRKNLVEIVKTLMEAGSDVNVNHCEPLFIAIDSGFKTIVSILLTYKKLRVNTLGFGNNTLLHVASKLGDATTVSKLLEKGADINALSNYEISPLHLAAVNGHINVAKVLIANRANINKKSMAGISPLQAAAASGHVSLVNLLISHKANIHNVNGKNESVLETAVSHCRSMVVESLLRYKDIKLNSNAEDKLPILHTAAGNGDLQIVQMLVTNGADVRALDSEGSMAIHMAIENGHRNIVQYLLANGCNIYDLGKNRWTLLHYAVVSNQYELVKFFIFNGCNINVPDFHCLQPIHHAAGMNFPNIVHLLMKFGAIYNAPDVLGIMPWQVTKNQEIVDLFLATDRLFAAVRNNNIKDVEKNIADGAFINALNHEYVSPLHRACWKGYKDIVEVLLKNNANPNITGKSGTSPLHYAAKFGHLEVVKLLLSYSAIFDAAATNGKTPMEFSCNADVIKLLKFIGNAFDAVEKKDVRVIKDLKSLKDVDALNIVMSAKNSNHESLIVFAMKSKFPMLDEMKAIVEKDFDEKLDSVKTFSNTGIDSNMLPMLLNMLRVRKAIFGSDNLNNLEIRSHVADVVFKLKKYEEALNVYREIFDIQIENYGVDAPVTLRTKSMIGLVLQKKGDYRESAQILQEAAFSQRRILTTNHVDTLNTLHHLAITLDKLKEYTDALIINTEVLEIRKALYGENNAMTLNSYSTMATVLHNQGKLEEAKNVYQRVFEGRSKLLGDHHQDTLRAMSQFGNVLFQQRNFEKALLVFKHILLQQVPYLGENHIDTLNTQYVIALILFEQKNLCEALIACKYIVNKRREIFGADHPTVHVVEKMISVIKFALSNDNMKGKENRPQKKKNKKGKIDDLIEIKGLKASGLV